MECPFREVEPFYGTSAELRRAVPWADHFVHAQVFFQMMGINEYYDMDKFDYDKAKLLHDLNTPVTPDLHDRFSLVVDGGTIEHIFDIKSAMANIVKVLRVGGWVVHLTPSSNFIDHGFYCFSPLFFYEFYSANGFEDFRCYLLEISRDFPMGYFKPCSYVEYTYLSPVISYLDVSKYIVVLFVARKKHSCDVINIPNQGTYDSRSKKQVQAVTGSSSVISPYLYFPSVYERWVPKTLQPVLLPLRPLLGRIWYRVSPPRSKIVKKVL